MATQQEIDALADAMGQLLDDMGVHGVGVCLYAKAKARVAFEPFLDPDCVPDFSLTAAKLVINRVEGEMMPTTNDMVATEEDLRRANAKIEWLRAMIADAVELLETGQSGCIPGCGEDLRWAERCDKFLERHRAHESKTDGMAKRCLGYEEDGTDEQSMKP